MTKSVTEAFMTVATPTLDERYRVLADIEEDAFLAGPDRYAEWQENGEEDNLLDIDTIFGKQIDRMVDELRSFDPHCLDPEDAPETPAAAAEGYRFRHVKSGVLLLDPDGKIAGGYLDADVAVDFAHQGQGLGAELILERYLRFGDLPTWHLDAAAYSPEGEAAHRSAWHLLQNPELVKAKLAIIDPA